MGSTQMCSVLFLTVVAASYAIPTNVDTAIIPMKGELPKEGRSLVIPALGLLVKTWQIACYLLSKTWFLAGLKLTALAVVANAIVWAIKHGLSAIVGAFLMFGFCKLTGLCGSAPPEIDYSQYPYELLETAESYLREGVRKFE